MRVIKIKTNKQTEKNDTWKLQRQWQHYALCFPTKVHFHFDIVFFFFICTINTQWTIQKKKMAETKKKLAEQRGQLTASSHRQSTRHQRLVPNHVLPAQIDAHQPTRDINSHTDTFSSWEVGTCHFTTFLSHICSRWLMAFTARLHPCCSLFFRLIKKCFFVVFLVGSWSTRNLMMMLNVNNIFIALIVITKSIWTQQQQQQQHEGIMCEQTTITTHHRTSFLHAHTHTHVCIM